MVLYQKNLYYLRGKENINKIHLEPLPGRVDIVKSIYKCFLKEKYPWTSLITWKNRALTKNGLIIPVQASRYINQSCLYS